MEAAEVRLMIVAGLDASSCLRKPWVARKVPLTLTSCDRHGANGHGSQCLGLKNVPGHDLNNEMLALPNTTMI